MNNGGDVLARGCPSAQFAGASSNITDFENDFIYMEMVDVVTKYGLSVADYDQYQAQRESGEKLPDLTPVALQETLEVGFSVTDHRKNYLSAPTEVKAVEEEAKKYPESTFEEFVPILDRLLIMRITDDPNEEMLEDGSTRNKTTGLITAAKYRQHSNVGIILAAGKYVVLSGTKFGMSEFVKPGDKVVYGEYNAEAFTMDEAKVRGICDRLQVNYVKDPKGMFVVRVQDVRGVEKRKDTSRTDEKLSDFAAQIPTNIYFPKGCEVRND